MFFKSKVFVACLAISALTAFGIGCGDDDDNGNGNGGGEYTSVDGSKEMGSLTADEEKQLCEDNVAYAKANAPSIDKQTGCNFSGNFAASFAYGMDPDLDAAKAACAEAATACMDADDEPVEETDPCAAPTEFADTCVATIDEFVACEQSKNAAFKDMFSNVKACDDLTVDDLTAEEGTDEEPSGPCATYSDKCE